MQSILASLFFSGLFFGSGPCLASCGPLLISYIAGTKTGVLKGLSTYALFSLARVAVYLVFSVLFFFLGSFLLERLLGAWSRYLIILAACFIILVGILLAAGRELEFSGSRFLKRYFIERDKKSIILLGVFAGLIPCAPLVAVFSYISLVSKSAFDSLLYMLSFGAGTFISPLLLLAVAAGSIPEFLKEAKIGFRRIFSLICGGIIIFLGLQLLRRVF